MNEMNKKEKPLLLIVDDEPRNIQLLGNLLNKHNYDIEFATSGEEALTWTATSQFDLILLDVMMPGMNGFDVCKKLKESPDTKEIPVIFLTAKTETDDIVKGFEHGGADYVCKPFNSLELLRRISTHLEIYQSRQKLIKQNEIQSELLHVLSHDLTNSLGPITALTEFIQEKPEDAKIYSSYIIGNVNNAMEIIDLSRTLLVAEEKPLDTSQLNLKHIFDQSVLFLQEKLKAKEIQLDMTVPEQVAVIAEEVSLKNSVIINLLTNAIKFSPRGSTIKITTKQDVEEQIKVYISDPGVGMASELVDDLFDLSKPTNRDGTEGERGTGFGMPLVKKFMQKYGGDIFVTSKAIEDFPNDHGTEICLRFNC